MTTPRLRAAVSALSLAATTLAAPLALGACAGAGGGATPAAFGDGVAPAPSASIVFVNEADVRVDVYLVTYAQEWRLGRVAPGVRTTLKLPAAALQEPMPGNLRLAVLADSPLSVQAARDPRAALTAAVPVSELLAQRWSFWHPRFGSARLLGAYERVGRR